MILQIQADTFAKLQSEVTELQEAIHAKDSDAAAEELGDLLFSCTNLARALDVDAEETLTAATEKSFAVLQRWSRQQPQQERR